MNDFVPEIIDRTLRLGRSAPSSTERFRDLKHDRDLLPQFQRQCERVLESYGKLSPITYDTQGFRDQGVDIVIRRHNERDEFDSLIGFQIKSTDDLLEKDWLKTLKAQHDESSRVKGLIQYYIVICVHEAAHKRRLRTIEADFKNALRTRIIEPTFADFFLTLSQERIDAFIRRTLASGDIVLKKALETVNFPSRMTGALLVYLTVRFFIESSGAVERAEVLGSGTLRGVYERLLARAWADYEDNEAEDAIDFDDFSEVLTDFESQLQQDLDALEDGPIIVNGDLITVGFEQVIPLVALATDAVARYDYPTQSVTPYLLDLLDLSG